MSDMQEITSLDIRLLIGDKQMVVIDRETLDKHQDQLGALLARACAAIYKLGVEHGEQRQIDNCPNCQAIIRAATQGRAGIESSACLDASNESGSRPDRRG